MEQARGVSRRLRELAAGDLMDMFRVSAPLHALPDAGFRPLETTHKPAHGLR